MPLPSPVAAGVALIAAIALTGCAALLDPRAERREADWADRYPPLGALVEVEGHRVHVLVTGRARGTAPDLVLIHGANGNLRDFTFDLVGRLEGRYRVIAVDRPGLGWSDSLGEADSDPAAQARVLHAAVAQVGISRPVVVGHSYGGSVAMAWALADPDDTGAVVLIAGATYPWPGELSLWYRLNSTVLGTSARAMVAALAPEGAADAAMAKVFAPAPVPEGYAEAFGAGLSLRRDQQASNNRQVNALLGYLTTMAPRYPRLTLPIELVHGDQDAIVGLEIHSRRMVEDVASAHLTVIPGAGHMPHHSHPQIVVDAIDRAAARAGAQHVTSR